MREGAVVTVTSRSYYGRSPCRIGGDSLVQNKGAGPEADVDVVY